jgi:PAS domain S-box-containing protein
MILTPSRPPFVGLDLRAMTHAERRTLLPEEQPAIDPREDGRALAEADFRGTFEQAPVGITHVAPDGRWLLVNQRFCEMLGYSREQLLTRRVQDLTYEGDRERDDALRAQLFAGEIPQYTVEKRYIRADGSTIWTRVTRSLARDQRGAPEYAITITEDITAQKVAELHARRAMDRAESFARELEFQKYALDEHAIVAITDRRGRITYANEKFLQISRYSREELLGQDHRIVNSGYHPKSFFTQMYVTIAGGRVWRGEIRNRAKDGSIYWVDTTIVPIKDQAGAVEGYVAIRADITERKRIERGLEFQKFALDQHAIVAITDRRGRITYVNDKFCQISKYSREELLGQDHRIVNSGYHPRSFFTEMYAAIARGNVWRAEIRNRAKDGSIYWVDTTIVPVQDDEGHVEGYVAIRADITDRKNAEEELRRQAAELLASNADLEDFAYITSHDLKEPLRGITNSAQLIAEDGSKLGEEDKERLDTIARLSQRMYLLLDSLLEYSRVGRAEFAKDHVNLNEVLATVGDSLQATLDGVELVVHPLPTVYCDRARVGQIFSNLISNAVKYNDAPRKRVEIAASNGAGGAVLYVKDNGIGIKDAHHTSIFRMFKRLHARERYGGGAGAGLTIVKRIVERHGGKVWLESTPGQGTTFFFTLGAPNPPRPSLAPPAAPT